MHPVEDFIYRYENPERDIMLILYHLISEQPGITVQLTFNLPFFYCKNWICYLYPMKKGGVELVFTRGNELSDESNLLHAKGRKLVKGIAFRQVNDIPRQSILELLHEALLLDQMVPYSYPEKKKRP
ncbi:MAG: DUF1801 domain-containing protein [Bacteroidota bacterium]